VVAKWEICHKNEELAPTTSHQIGKYKKSPS